MKLEPNAYYILGNGQLAKMFIESDGRMLGAIYEAGARRPYWGAYHWEIDGSWLDREGSLSPRLSVCGKITTRHVYPPIPARSMDWAASYDNDEPNDNGSMRQGWGKTEIEAVLDLVGEAYPGEERAEMMMRARARSAARTEHAAE